MKDKQQEEDLLQTLRNLPRASPPPEVWANIERIVSGGATIRTLSRADWRQTAVAAALVLFLNTAAVFWSLGQDTSTMANAGNDGSLISNYELYE